MIPDPQVRLTADDWRVLRESLRPLDCGHHYCRYCEAGTSNHWEHIPSCPYEDSVRNVERAKKLLEQLAGEAVSVRSQTKTECCEVPIRGDQRFCPKCGYEARVIP